MADNKGPAKPVSFMHEPAAIWSKGIPLGNGRLGVMIWGGPFETYMSLNADRLWRNKFQYRIEDKTKVFQDIRELCRQGRWAEAEKMSLQLTPHDAGFDSCQPRSQIGVNPYQPAGQIRISLRHNCGAQKYRRQLDFNNGVSTVSYLANKQEFLWESFVSAIDDVAVTRIRITGAASAPLPITRIDIVRLLDPQCGINAYTTPDNIMVLSGEFAEGVRFAAAVAVTSDKGSQNLQAIPVTVVHSAGYRTEVAEAESIIVLSTVYVDSESNNPAEACLDRLRLAKKKEFSELYDEHVADYRSFSARCQIDLGGAAESNVDNAELLRKSCETVASPALFERIFEMGRYLMISGSRPGTLPLNLQGIWNNDLAPAWDCDFHYDLNIQQSYWPAEVTNLSECHLPLADLLNAQIPAYRENARKIYGMNGLYMPICSDLSGRFWHGFWCSAPCFAAWMAQHLWWHWEYSLDRSFLQKQAAPFMTEAIRFYLDYVQEDEKGNLFISPTFSPENKADDRNSYYGRNATIDLILIAELFKNYIEASRCAQVDEQLLGRCKVMLAKWPKPDIDSDGKLCEMENAAYEHFHRHLSHLIGLYPASVVSTESNVELLNAYRKAMEHRRKYGFDDWMSLTWSWMGLLHARLGEAEEAIECLDILARAFFMDNLLSCLFDAKRLGWGTLWADAPGDTPYLFQIEGGMATTALIAEMLLQSHNGIIRVLPALPSRWADGKFSGLKARGGFEVSAVWSQRKVGVVEIKSLCGSSAIVHIPVKHAGIVKAVSDGKTLWTKAADVPVCSCSFDTQRGRDYIISMDYR